MFICVQNQRGIKFWDPSWGHRFWQSEFNYCSDRILICSILIFPRKPMWGWQKALFCWFWFLVGAFNYGWVTGFRVGQKVLFRDSCNCIFFQLEFSTFEFYDPLMLQISVPWEFLKTQITISINIFICFNYYTVWNSVFL